MKNPLDNGVHINEENIERIVAWVDSLSRKDLARFCEWLLTQHEIDSDGSINFDCVCIPQYMGMVAMKEFLLSKQ